MKPRVIPQKFVANDGSEWKSEAEAERQNALVDALGAFERARSNVLAAIAETHRTADGHLFQIGISDRYFVIVDGLAGPEVSEVWISCPYYNRRITVDSVGRVFVTDDRNAKQPREFQIKQLYKDRAAAEREWVKHRREWGKRELAYFRQRRKAAAGLS